MTKHGGIVNRWDVLQCCTGIREHHLMERMILIEMCEAARRIGHFFHHRHNCHNDDSAKVAVGCQSDMQYGLYSVSVIFSNDERLTVPPCGRGRQYDLRPDVMSQVRTLVLALNETVKPYQSPWFMI